MIRSIRILSLLLLLTMLTTYYPNYNGSEKSFIFPIKKIEIENTILYDPMTLAYDLKDIKGMSLLLINYHKIKKLILDF